MFDLSLVDHLRLSFGHVVSRHKAHTATAAVRARWSRIASAVQAHAIAAALVTSLCGALGKGDAFEMATAVLVGLALITWLVQFGLDLDGTARAHAAYAARLWHVREAYRALLADLADGAIDLDQVRQRRDALMHDVHGIYTHAAGDPQASRLAPLLDADDGVLTDDDIDRLLPASFRRAWKSATA